MEGSLIEEARHFISRGKGSELLPPREIFSIHTPSDTPPKATLGAHALSPLLALALGSPQWFSPKIGKQAWKR